MGLWSMLTTLSTCSAPATRAQTSDPGPRPAAPDRARYRVSCTRLDLPEPDTPVTHVMTDSGSSASTDRRLFAEAPSIRSQPAGERRRRGSDTRSRPERYWPVIDEGSAMTSPTEPWTTTLPPCTPGPGPMSMMQSASRIASSSCSTTMTVLPRPRSRTRESSSRRLSRWCKPIEGSSRMYITPTSPAPIWLARRIRRPPLPTTCRRTGRVRGSRARRR